MNHKAVAIVGSYRRGGITEQTVDAMLAALAARGVVTEKVVLREKRIEFCRNCRTCTQASADQRRGTCVIPDEMSEILAAIDAADGVILAAPVNFGSITAIMKRFVERLIVYTYWPWTKMIPVNRIRTKEKRAVLVSSSGAPAILNRIIMPCPLRTLRQATGVLGARVVETIYLGSVNKERDQRLSARQLRQAESAARALLA